VADRSLLAAGSSRYPRQLSELYGGLDRQPPRRPNVFTVGMWHWGISDPHSARTDGWYGQTGGNPQPHPHLLAHVF
jgi:hypothetical protein